MQRLTSLAVGVVLSLAIVTPSDTFGQVIIDDFQAAHAVSNPTPTVVGPSGGMIGGTRTGRVAPSSASSTMNIGGGQAAFFPDPTGGNVVLEWDGDMDAATYSETGLVGEDLTMDAGFAPQIGLTFDVLSTGPYSLNIVVSTDGDYASALPAAGVGPETVKLLFADFAPTGPLGGADFSNVGAILVNFLGAAPFAIGNIETCPDPALPVELASFSAVASGSVVNLKWTVSSQVDNAGFEVEHRRAADASDWHLVGFVPSTGTEGADVSYAFNTDVGLAGQHQFRLRMIDLDGSFTYSPMTEVSVDVPGSFVLGKAYPNPFNPSTQFTLALAQGQDVSIAVYDLLGRRVKELHQGFLDGSQSHQFRLDASELSTGIYIIKAAGQFETSSEVVSLVK